MTREEHNALYNPVVDEQTRLRVKLAVAAYAYEFLSTSLMTDDEFDNLSKKVDISIDTRRPDLDFFFRTEFSPDTGMWVRKHPDIKRIAALAVARCPEYD